MGHASVIIVLLCAFHPSCADLIRLPHRREPLLSIRPRGSARRDVASAFVSPRMQNGRAAGRRSNSYVRNRFGARGSSLASDTEKDIDEIHTRSNANEGISHYHLTILIPAYNERDRIGMTLLTYVDILSRTPVYQHHRGDTTSGRVSILVVDDGSTDGTAEYVRGNSWRGTAVEEQKSRCWKVDESVSCITLPENAGKGAALERGMAELPSSYPDDNDVDPSAVRSVVLVADADGSGDISCIDGMLRKLEELLEPTQTASRDESLALVVGYRRYPESKSPLRALLSWGFRQCVSLIFIGNDLGVRDTQCGFKLMTAATGKALYRNLHLRRWTQDVEVIMRARLLGVPVGESGVSWVDKPGSKLVSKASDAVVVSLIMLYEIAVMRAKYSLGHWSASE